MLLYILIFIAALVGTSAWLGVRLLNGLMGASIAAPWGAVVTRNGRPLAFWLSIALFSSAVVSMVWFATVTAQWTFSPYLHG
jgi:hypothetical protein